MAETTVQQKVCKACGAEIRPHSMFCYNCGSSVSVEKNGKTEISDIWLRENIAEDEKSEPIVKEEKVEILEKTEKTEESSEPIHLNQSKSELPKSETEKVETELKPASEMRRKAKSYQQKQVEIVWEEPENVSNIKLILATLLLLGFAVAVIFLAFYLK
ncbi:MAG TPA: zinc ribbon domain-containing protein [Pyrinomonadaceae bacterium]|nr:zinc ribbon domain-containing protein [Pyrinomonadaceae bacterium]